MNELIIEFIIICVTFPQGDWFHKAARVPAGAVYEPHSPRVSGGGGGRLRGHEAAHGAHVLHAREAQEVPPFQGGKHIPQIFFYIHCNEYCLF